MFKSVAKFALPLALIGIASAPTLNAQNIDAIRAEINALKNSYESRIKNLENKLSAMKNQHKPKGAGATTAATEPADEVEGVISGTAGAGGVIALKFFGLSSDSPTA